MNGKAYFAAIAVSYKHNVFMKSTTGVNAIKPFFSLSLTLQINKLYRLPP
jgi:hypothetical protein